MSEELRQRRAAFVDATNLVLQAYILNGGSFGARMLMCAEVLGPDDFATVQFLVQVLPKDLDNVYDIIAALAGELIEARTRLCILGAMSDADRLKSARPLWRVR